MEIFRSRATRAKNSWRSFRAAISTEIFDCAANCFTSARPTQNGSCNFSAVSRTSFSSASLARPRNWWLKCATEIFQRCFWRANSAREAKPSNPRRRKRRREFFARAAADSRVWISCSTRWRNSFTRPSCCFFHARASGGEDAAPAISGRVAEAVKLLREVGRRSVRELPDAIGAERVGGDAAARRRRNTDWSSPPKHRCCRASRSGSS